MIESTRHKRASQAHCLPTRPARGSRPIRLLISTCAPKPAVQDKARSMPFRARRGVLERTVKRTDTSPARLTNRAGIGERYLKRL